MNFLKILVLGGLCVGVASPVWAQNTFTITGTSIPVSLLKLNYGPLPKGIEGFDLNICNVTDIRHPLTSSEIYQALAESQGNLRPIGRQIMLAVILRNQNHSLKTWLAIALNSTSGVLSVLGTGRSAPSSGVLSATGLGAVIGQQLLATWSPVLTADQVEKFESQVLEPALVMDGGSCVERTVFANVPASSKTTAKHAIPNFELHLP